MIQQKKPFCSMIKGDRKKQELQFLINKGFANIQSPNKLKQQKKEQISSGKIFDCLRNQKENQSSYNYKQSLSELKILQKLKEQSISFIEKQDENNQKNISPTSKNLGSSSKKLLNDSPDSNFEINIKYENDDYFKNEDSATFQVKQRGSVQNQNNKSEEQKVKICGQTGHDSNQIKYICLSGDCQERLNKGCAQCMLQFHKGHLDQVDEILTFQTFIQERYNQATNYYLKSQPLIVKLNKHPLENFFQQLRETFLNKIKEIEEKIIQIYNSEVRDNLKQDLFNIKKFNQQFENYSDLVVQECFENQKQLDKLVTILNGEGFEKYVNSLEDIQKKFKNNQITVDSQNIQKIQNDFEVKVVELIQSAMVNEKSNYQESDQDNLITFQCDSNNPQKGLNSQLQNHPKKQMKKLEINKINHSPKQIFQNSSNSLQSSHIMQRSQSFHLPVQILPGMLTSRTPIPQNLYLAHLNSSRSIPKQICIPQTPVYYKNC